MSKQPLDTLWYTHSPVPTGLGIAVESGRLAEAFLPSPKVQNHAAFLAPLPGGDLLCAWFGGTIEGKSDISIHAAILPKKTAPGYRIYVPLLPKQKRHRRRWRPGRG